MIIKPQDVKTKEDFFEYLSDYMEDGDKLQCEELEDESKVYTLISPCGYALVGFNTRTGMFHV